MGIQPCSSRLESSGLFCYIVLDWVVLHRPHSEDEVGAKVRVGGEEEEGGLALRSLPASL